MGVLDGIVKFFEDAGGQLSRTQNFWRYEADKRVIRFGKKFFVSAEQYGVSEKDALDVYYHGYMVSSGKMVKKYNGYEIGILYWIATDTGVIVITYTWKKRRL